MELLLQRGDGILQRGEPAPADRQRRVPGDIELSMLRRRSNPRFLGMMIVGSIRAL